MNKIVKNTLILTVITLVAGTLLGLVYEVTKAPIATAQENAKQEAYRTVLSDAASFEEYAEFDESEAASALKEGGYESDDITEVAAALDESGETVGYVITVTSHEGYGGDIKISVGILSDGTVKGIEMLTIAETAGLGMKAKEDSFSSQFAGKQEESFEVTKTGATSDNQIDAISGATITSSAVTSAVNAGLAYYRSLAQ